MSEYRSCLTPAEYGWLADLFPGDGLVVAREAARIYGSDASRRFAPPLAVVRPDGVEPLKELMRWAQSERIPVYTRGRATNVVGGCVPDPPGIVVSTLRLKTIEAIDGGDFVADVQPGVVTADLQQACAAQKLFYPPDPASVGISTIGGNVATGAGGMRALKYGVTRDYVLGLEAVLPGGELVSFGGRTHKNVVGLDLARLFVGSEGSLGVITKLHLKLLPLPEASGSVLACFASLENALECSRAIFASGLLPTAMELLDYSVLQCLERLQEVPWPEQTRAALLLKLDGTDESLAPLLERLERTVLQFSPVWQAQGQGDAEEKLWELRRLINPASYQAAPDKISDDVTVPRSQVRRLIEGVRAIAQARELIILTFGHLGDGNIHVNVMHDASDPVQLQNARAAKEQVALLTLELGGTLSGEHGVGLSKLPMLHKQLPERERALMRGVKAVFDPYGIMNPDKAY